MTKKGKKKNQRQQRKSQGRILKCILRCWNNNLMTSKAEIRGGMTSMNSKGCVTTADPETPAFMMQLGAPLRYGSLTMEEFTPRLLHMPLDRNVARLGLMTQHRERLLHPKNMMKSINNDSLIGAAGGPYSSTDLNKVAICRMLKNYHRGEILQDNIPVFEDIFHTVQVYQEHQNGFWAMFYAEFYRLVNHMIRESCVLMPKEMGFTWSKNALGFAKMESDKGVKNKKYCAMVDAIMLMIDEVVNMTPCLLHPVGIQHMIPGEVFGIQEQIHDCLQVICGKTSWLGECCTTSGTVITRPTKENFKLKQKWKIVRTMVINTRCALFDAVTITSVTGAFIQNFMRLPASYVPETIEEAHDEDPLFYGYRLRTIEMQRNIRDREPLQKGWCPFNYSKFVKCLSLRTGVPEVDYFPPYLQLRGAISMLVGMSSSSSIYTDAWNKGLGVRHEHVLMNMVERMRAEYATYPTFFYYDEPEYCIQRYPPYLAIVLRTKDYSNLYDETRGLADLHRPPNMMEVVFATWGATLIHATYNVSYKSAVIGYLDVPFALWKPYAPPPPEPENQLQRPKSNLTRVVLPQLIKEKRKRIVMKRTMIKFKWKNISAKVLAMSKWRSFFRRKRTRSLAAEVYSSFLNERREGVILKLAKELEKEQEALERKKEKEQEALERKKEEEGKALAIQKARQDAYISSLANELRKRLEFFIIHNIFNDGFLMANRNPNDGSFPVRVFLGFPSLQHLVHCTVDPITFFMHAASMSKQIEPVNSFSFVTQSPEPSIKPRVAN